MEYKKLYNWANLLKNYNGGKPMFKDGQQIKNNKGELVLSPHFNCSITIKEALPVGEYEIKFREKASEKGTIYYSGGISPKKESNYKPNSHYQAKANGYQPNTKGLVKPLFNDKDFIDDDVPF